MVIRIAQTVSVGQGIAVCIIAVAAADASGKDGQFVPAVAVSDGRAAIPGERGDVAIVLGGGLLRAGVYAGFDDMAQSEMTVFLLIIRARAMVFLT